jgi:hypothetical protein
MIEKFSKRHGFQQTHATEITVRQDAPYELRGMLIQIAYDCGFRPKILRPLVCRTLRKRPDLDNWSGFPNIDDEVHVLIDNCEWYRVYDIIEAISAAMRETPYTYEADMFESEINDYFLENCIGWKLSNGKVEMRGPGLFEEIIGTAERQLATIKFSTARNELYEARRDLSRRPAPDITGGIQHSMAALECVAREACGDAKATLGEIMRRYPDTVPRPLDVAIEKAWGYASENARHIREGREPTFEEAELVVGMVAALATYLARKHEV